MLIIRIKRFKNRLSTKSKKKFNDDNPISKYSHYFYKK